MLTLAPYFELGKKLMSILVTYPESAKIVPTAYFKIITKQSAGHNPSACRKSDLLHAQLTDSVNTKWPTIQCHYPPFHLEQLRYHANSRVQGQH
jgi:hypothetical protein